MANETGSECKHRGGRFNAKLQINHLADINRWMATVAIRCGACNQPFRFVGVPEYGALFSAPALSEGGCELRIPITPGALTDEQIKNLQYDPVAAGDHTLTVNVTELAELAQEMRQLETFNESMRNLLLDLADGNEEIGRRVQKLGLQR